MNPEELIQSIQEFSETPLYQGYPEEYTAILDSYSRIFSNPETRTRDSWLETALVSFLEALKNPSIIDGIERNRRRQELLEKLEVYTHRHFKAFSEYSSSEDRVENQWIDLISNGILPFLEAESKTLQDSDEIRRIQLIINEFKSLEESLKTETRDEHRNTDALIVLMEAIIARYEIARESETIDERINLLESQLVEVQELYRSYLKAKEDARQEAIRWIAEWRSTLTYGITDVMAIWERAPGIQTWIEDNLSLYPSANPLNTETPEFEVWLKMVSQVDAINITEEVEPEEAIEQVIALWKSISLPFVENVDVWKLNFIDSQSLSPQLKQIFDQNPDFYKAALERAITSMPEIWSLTEIEQKARVEEFIFDEFNAFTKWTLSDTFTMLQNQLNDGDLYEMKLPWWQVVSFATWDESTWEIPTQREKEEAILERNKAIATSLLFLNSLYREDVWGVWNIEFYWGSIAGTMWDIYTLNILSSEYEDIQWAINIMSWAYLINRIISTRNYLRIPFTERFVPWAWRVFRSYREWSPEYEAIKPERERIRDYLISQAQREWNASWETRINRAYEDLHLHKSDRLFYSAMEETWNSFRRYVGNITRFSAPIDIVSGTAFRYFPSRWVNQGWTPRQRLNLRAVRQGIDNIQASPYITPTSYKILNEHFEHIRKNKWSLDWFYEYDMYLKELNDMGWIHSSDRSIIQEQIEKSLQTNKWNANFEWRVSKRLWELTNEAKQVIEIRWQFDFSDDMTQPIESEINKRIENWFRKDDAWVSINKLHTNSKNLSDALDNIVDMEWDSNIKSYLIQRLASWVEKRNLEQVSRNVSNMVESLEHLNEERYAKIRSHIYNSDGTVNEQFLKDFHEFWERVKGYDNPEAWIVAYNELVSVYPERSDTDPRPTPPDTPTPTTPDEAPETRTGALIDAEWNWTNADAQKLYEANMLHWAINGVDIDEASIDTLLSNAQWFTTIDELKTGLSSITPDILDNADNLETLRGELYTLQAEDIMKRSLLQQGIRFNNLSANIDASGMITVSYIEGSSGLMSRWTSKSNTFESIDSLLASQNVLHEWAVPEWNDLTLDRRARNSLPDSLEDLHFHSSQRMRILRYLRKLR